MGLNLTQINIRFIDINGNCILVLLIPSSTGFSKHPKNGVFMIIRVI